MTKEEFKMWFEANVGCFDYTGEYRYETDYANCIWDYYQLCENSIELRYEELYWGGSEWITKDFSFENFIERYNNDTLKD